MHTDLVDDVSQTPGYEDGLQHDGQSGHRIDVFSLGQCGDRRGREPQYHRVNGVQSHQGDHASARHRQYGEQQEHGGQAIDEVGGYGARSGHPLDIVRYDGQQG